MNVLQQHQLKHRTAYPPQGGSTNSPAPTAVTTNQTSSSKRETLSVVPLLDDSPAGSTVQTTSQKLRRGNAACEDEEVLTADVAQQDFIRWLMISGTNNHDSFQLIDHTMLSPMVRRGIPEPLRGGVWKKMLMSRNASATNHTWLYQSLLEVRECPCRGDIFRDISRTFPRHALFRERASPGQSALLNVLCAYSLRNPAVGYCQGMGFVVGFILSFMTEEDTFYFLDALLSKMEISDLYTPGLPLLESYFNLFRELLKIEMPTLSCHLEDENVDVSMYSSQWFMTIFTYNLNFNVCMQHV
eukprot:Lankesteria_metandrocarpae@DN3989_c0_g1_i3.p1